MISNHEWLVRNSLRSYPVREDAPIVATSQWRLPPGLIVDVMISGSHSAENVCVQSVTVTPSLCSVVLGDPVSGTSLAVATCVLDSPGDTVLSPLVEDVAGFISFGPAMLRDNYSGLPQGFHDFGQETLLESRCVLFAGPAPVRSIVSPAGVRLGGNVQIQTGGQLDVTVATTEEDGEVVQYVTIGLSTPSNFLSPCENKTSLCGCAGTPIQTINGVPGNPGGIITLELEDASGQVIQLGPHALSMLITRSANVFCAKPEEPDEHGRIKGVSGSYDDDTKPVTPYRNPLDLTFPNPAL